MLTNPHFRWCLALLLNLMMKYLEKAPANVAAILSCTCWKPSWKMLLFSQFCSKISNNNPPNPLNSELRVFLSVLFSGWPISEGGIAVSNFGCRVPAVGSRYSLGLWPCNFEGSEQVSAWNQRAPGPLSAVLGLRFGAFLKSLPSGALSEDKHDVVSSFRAP